MTGRNSFSGGRSRLPFRAVNRRGQPGPDPALQRHHLLPCQLLSLSCFSRILDAVGRERVGFNDFRRNGLLLPAKEEAVRRLSLPLHRGPHRDYNAMVIDRVGQIEQRWSRDRMIDSNAANNNAGTQIALLQRDLRRRLLDQRTPFRLSRKDPLGSGIDFSGLDAFAEDLWRAA